MRASLPAAALAQALVVIPFPHTCISGVWAALGKPASRRRVDGRSELALYGRTLEFHMVDVYARYGGQQRLGIGMLGIVEQLLSLGHLYALAQIHDGYLI